MSEFPHGMMIDGELQRLKVIAVTEATISRGEFRYGDLAVKFEDGFRCVVGQDAVIRNIDDIPEAPAL